MIPSRIRKLAETEVPIMAPTCEKEENSEETADVVAATTMEVIMMML
jgi:hypothetical protein